MARRNSGRYQEHSFYCIRCGNKGIPLMRKEGQIHSKDHRKKLYCPYCRMEVNHIECKNYEEVLDFKEKFESGFFKEEAEESIAFTNKENFKNVLSIVRG